MISSRTRDPHQSREVLRGAGAGDGSLAISQKILHFRRASVLEIPRAPSPPRRLFETSVVRTLSGICRSSIASGSIANLARAVWARCRIKELICRRIRIERDSRELAMGRASASPCRPNPNRAGHRSELRTLQLVARDLSDESALDSIPADEISCCDHGEEESAIGKDRLPRHV